MTLHYKDGVTVPQVGDLVKGPVYGFTGVVVGTVLKLADSADHNCDVAFVEVIGNIDSFLTGIFSGPIPSMVIGTDASGKKHGAVARIEQADTQALVKL